MTAIQFFTANSSKISAKCAVTVTSLFVRLDGVWNNNQAIYYFKSSYERKAILRILRDADCILYLDTTEAEAN